MTTTAIKALKLALTLDDADAMRVEIVRALESLQQQPARFDDIGLHRRLTQKIKAEGSAAALARRMGVSKQYLGKVLDGTRPASETILDGLGLRRATGKAMYTPLD